MLPVQRRPPLISSTPVNNGWRRAMKTSRRGFLKSGLACAAAAALPCCAKREKEYLERKPKQPVVTRTLGRTGIEIPIVSMG
jgi:hypothetical protein